MRGEKEIKLNNLFDNVINDYKEDFTTLYNYLMKKHPDLKNISLDVSDYGDISFKNTGKYLYLGSLQEDGSIYLRAEMGRVVVTIQSATPRTFLRFLKWICSSENYIPKFSKNDYKVDVNLSFLNPKKNLTKKHILQRINKELDY